MRLYAKRDIEAQAGHYMRHICAMTDENLQSKSDIAAELAHRDIQIARLKLDNKILLNDLSIVRRDLSEAI